MRLRNASLAALGLLGLLAPGCDGEPPDSDATVRLDAASHDDGELWLAPGTVDDLYLDSQDRELADWELDSLDPEIASVGIPSVVAESTNQIQVRVSASRVGDSTVMIHDEVGALVTELPVHVRNPDDLSLYGLCSGGSQCLPGRTLRLLRGEVVPFGGIALFDERPLPGAPVLAIAADPDGLVSLGLPREPITVRAPTAGPSSFELTAGPDARARFEVIGVDAAAITATVVGSEETAPAGSLVWVRLALTDAAGEVLAWSFRWRGDADAWTESRTFSYTYDPTAAPSEVTFAVGEGASEIQRTVTIHRGE